MIKRLFEYIALCILAVLGLAKLRGRRVNPLALRVLLGIFSFMAYSLDVPSVLLFSGTWLIFLLAGDLGGLFGWNLKLFDPVAEEAGNAQNSISFEAENSLQNAEISTTRSVLKDGIARVKGLFSKTKAA